MTGAVDAIVGWRLMGWSLNPRALLSLDLRDFRRMPLSGQSLPRAWLLFHEPDLVELASIARGVTEEIEVEAATLASTGGESVDGTIRVSRGGRIRVVARSHSLLLV